MQNAPRRHQLVDVLQSATAECIRLHIAVHGTTEIKTKHHRMQHIPSQIRKDEYVLDCFLSKQMFRVVLTIHERD